MNNPNQNGRGKLILIFAPTGSGKSVLINHIREEFPELTFLTSCTTRAPRTGHENSSYTFLTVEEFKTRIEQGDFLEWADVDGNYYGTLKSELEKVLSEGRVVIKEMDIQGVLQVREILDSGELEVLYIDAGSWEELERRVRARAPISEEELASRRMRYEKEILFKDGADFVIHNLPGELDAAKKEFEAVVGGILEQVRG